MAIKDTLQIIEGSVLAPKGFKACGIFCDIKRLGTGKGSNKGQKRDLGLLVSEVPAIAAGMFTTSLVCAAPVKISQPRAAAGAGQAVVVNSGNANACTGERGLKDALKMAALAAKGLKLPEESLFVCSTGRIGLPLPMKNVAAGIEAALGHISSDPAAADHFAEAILTSDSRKKQIAVEIELSGKKVRIGGCCKGAGMIQPGMSPTGARPASQAVGLHATMLGFITTDAAIAPKALQQALEMAVAVSFNRVTVDGDMSTNDTVLVLANGLAGNPKLGPSKKADLEQFQEALNFVCLELAKMIVRDGEGVSRFVTLHVHGAKNAADAELAARAVSNSALVKTSWFGGDPNWGRVLGALGYSGAHLVEAKIDLAYCSPDHPKLMWTVRKGQPTKTPFADQVKLVGEKEFELHVFLNVGRYCTTVYTCDLTEAYVDFNKGDVSNPNALGG
jgi:glutamate N-acetyltransferase/amino-acid N-acetyltransferase